MEASKLYALTAFHRVQVFLDANAAKVGVIAQVEARQVLNSVVAQLEAFAIDQGSFNNGINGQSSTQKSLQRELRKEHMQPIAEFARAKLRGVPKYAELTV